MPQAATPKKGRFVTNLVANFANFGLSILVGLWLTPYIIRHLGVAAYGLWPLAATVISYMSLVTVGLNSAVGRFMTIALDRQDKDEANRIFNTSLWGIAGILLVLLGPVLWLSLQAQFFFDVPAGYEGQFYGLFLCSIGAFYLTTLENPFGTSSFCLNRLELSNMASIAGTITRVAVILILFNIGVPKILHVGLAMLLAAAVSFTLSVGIWRYLTPMLRVQRSAFSRQTFGRLSGMGGWMVINQVGSLLYLNIDLMVVNKMLGAVAGGQYGAVMMWSTMLRTLAGVMSGVFGPTIISLYGRNDMSALVTYCRRAVKFVGLMIALPIGLICGLAQPLLRIWLGPAFEPLAPLMMLMSIHLCVNLAVLPLFSIQVATNHVRVPGILTCIMGVGNLGLALLLAGPIGWGMYGVAAAGAVMLTAKNIIFTPIYAAHILGQKCRTFYREIFPVVGTTLVLAGLGWWFARKFDLSTWLDLVLSGVIFTALYLLVTYQFLLTNEERKHVLSLIFPKGAALRI